MQQILSLLSNPLILVGAMSAIFIVFMYYNTMKGRGPLTEVYLLRPRDKRGEVHTAEKETDLGIICKRKADIVHRFIKAGCGWTFSVAGRVVTKFFGLEGIAYTALLENGAIIKKDLSDYLVFLWGNEFYDSIPAQFRKAVEEDKVGVTVEVERLDPADYGLPNLRSSDINDDTDAKVLSKIGGGEERKLGQDLYQIAIWFLLGASTVYFLMTRGML
jgi:hypothetical protein